MKKILFAFVFIFLLSVTQVSAVSMFVNWPDGGDEYRYATQGNDISFNYESYDYNEHVHTEVVLINSIDPYNPVDIFVDRYDYKGDYGFVTFPTDNLPAGDYAIYGEATVEGNIRSIAEVDFTLEEKVVPNTAPYFDTNIPDYFEYYLSEENDILFNVANYAHDDEGNSLSFHLDTSNTNSNIVNCNLYFESSLYCEFIGSGITTVDVVVSDGDLSTSHAVTIKIIDDTVYNTAPYFMNLPSPFDYPVSYGLTDVVKLSDYAFDDEGDSLSYSISGNNNAVSCSVKSDSTLNCDMLAIGSATITVTVSDGDLSAQDFIIINVYDDADPNTAPFFVNLPTYFEYAVGQGSADMIDLADYAQDNENDDLTFSVNEQVNGFDCSIVQDSILRCNFNTVQTKTFTVSVSDGEFSDMKTITLAIIPDPIENTAPYWSNLAFNYRYDVDVGSAVLAKLSSFAHDNEGDTLSYILDESSTNKNIANCLIDSSNNLKCYFAGSLGMTTVDVIVNDGELSATQTLSIEVYETNAAPNWSENIPMYFEYDIDLENVNLMDVAHFVTDANFDELSYFLNTRATNFKVVDCGLASSQLSCDLIGLGITNFILGVTDGEFTIYKTITVKVFQDNTKPYWNSDVTKSYSYHIDESQVTVLNLQSAILDKEYDLLIFTLDESNTDKSVVDCFISSSKNLVCDLNGLGTTTVKITAKDAEFTSTFTMSINVYDTNDAPQWSATYPTYFEYDIDLENVNLMDIANFVTDPDGDILSYSLVESNTNKNIVDCSLSGSDLSCDLNGLGSTTVDVIVSDGEFSIRKSITIKVFQDNVSPVWGANIPTEFSYPLSSQVVTVIRVSNFVSDADNDNLYYSLSESNTNKGVVDCYLESDTDLVCVLNGVGSTTLDLLVSDVEFTIKQTLTIAVYDDNHAPYWSSNTPDFFEYDIDLENVNVKNFAAYAYDVDGDTLSYSLDESSTNTNIVDCSLSGSLLNCALNGLGQTTVDILVSDGSLTDRHTVTIRAIQDNTAPAWNEHLKNYFSYHIDESRVTVFNLPSSVSDIQRGDILTFDIIETSTDKSVVDCFISANNDLVCDLIGLGTTTLKLTVSDSEFTVPFVVTINVYDTNEAPVWSVDLPTYFEYDIDEENVDVLNVADFVTDSDGDILFYSLDESSTNKNIVDCSLSGSDLSCDLNGVGSTAIDVVVSDGEFSIRKTLTIKVYQDNVAPRWSVNMPIEFSYPISNERVTVMRVSNFVSDADNDNLHYSLSESNTNKGVVDCYLESDTDLVCVLNGVGSTTVDVIVSDAEFTIAQIVTIAVYDDNHAPYFTTNMPTFFEYDVDLKNVQVMDVSDYARDDDGDMLSYSLDDSNTNDNIIDCVLVGSILKCDLFTVGQTTVDIIVSDGNESVRTTVTIRVIQDNTAPAWNEHLEDYYSYHIDESQVIVLNLPDSTSDIQRNDILTFNLIESDTDFGVLDCFISANKDLVCDLNGLGTTAVTLTVSDSEFTVPFVVTINVFDDNVPPVWSVNLPIYFKYDIDEEYVTLMDVADYVFDANNDVLSYSLDESDTDKDVVDCILSGSDLSCVLNGVGSTTVTLIVSDGDFSIRKTVTIVVCQDNVPPVWSANIPTEFSYHIDESQIIVMRVSDFVSDADDDDLYYSLSELNTDKTVVDCYLESDTDLVCVLNGVGFTSVELVVSDAEFDIKKTVNIEVYDTNDSPYWSVSLPTYFEYDIDEGNVNLMDIVTHVVDPDGDALVYSLDKSSTNIDIVDCSLSGSVLNCDLNAVGRTTVDVVVSDGEFSIRKTLTIKVFQDNTAPVWDVYLDDYFSYHIDDSRVVVFNLIGSVFDFEYDSLSFSLDGSNTDESVVDCFINSQKSLVCDLNGLGTTTVTLTVSDSEFTVPFIITINVYDTNEAPVWSVDLPTYFEYDIDLAVVSVMDVADYVTDVDGDILFYSLDESNTNKNIVDCSLSGSDFSCDLNGLGSTTVDVIVSDGEFSIQKSITIEVYQDNVAPQWDLNMPLEFTYPLSDQVVTVIRVSDYVSDADGDSLNYMLNQANTNRNVVDCYLESDTDLICVLDGIGSTTLELIVKDAEFRITKTITINVYDDNHAPYFATNMPDFFEYDIDLEHVDVLDIASYAYDVDGDILSYSLDDSNTNTNIVDCTLVGSVLNCDLNNIGQTTVDIIVSDGSLFDRHTITIQVFQDNTPPYFEDLQLEYSYDIDLDNVDVVKLSEVTVDAQNDALTYAIDDVNTGENIVSCTIQTDSTLHCNLEGLGITTLDIIVSDAEFNTKVTITIDVYDDNVAPIWSVDLPTYFEYDIDLSNVDVMDIANYVIDANNDVLFYNLDNSNTNLNIVDCSLSSSRLNCALNNLGLTTLDVIVSDGKETIRQTITIKVFQDNVAPIWDLNMPTYFEYNLSLEEANLLRVLDYATDADDDQLFVTLDTSATDANVATCTNLADSTIHCDFVDEGLTTMRVTVSDAEFSITRTLTIQIIDDFIPIGPTAIISADGTRNSVGSLYHFNGLQSFATLDESITSYDWVIKNPDNVAIAIFNGPVQSYTFNDQNEYVLELTVTDTQGLTDTARYTLQSRWSKTPKQEYESENGLFVNSLEIHGVDFEVAQVEGEILIVATIENEANRDFENVRMTFMIPEIGLKIKSNAIDLDEGERKTLQIFDYLPDYVEEGVYYPVVSFSDTDIIRSKPMYLEVIR